MKFLINKILNASDEQISGMIFIIVIAVIIVMVVSFNAHETSCIL